MSVSGLNYLAIAERVLRVGAEIARRPAMKQNQPDALAVKACIDALDKELEKLEKMADEYRAEFSCMTVLEFPRGAKTAHLGGRDDNKVLVSRTG